MLAPMIYLCTGAMAASLAMVRIAVEAARWPVSTAPSSQPWNEIATSEEANSTRPSGRESSD